MSVPFKGLPKNRNEASSMTKKMYERWHASNKSLPKVDKTDIQEALIGKSTNQQYPEFA